MTQDYRKNMDAWCNDYQHGAKPSKVCRDCDKPDLKQEGDKILIGKPSNFKPKIRVTEATMKRGY